MQNKENKNHSGLLLFVFILLLAIYFTNFFPAKGTNSTQNTPVIADDSKAGTDSIATSNYANPSLNYYYYIPKKVANNNIRKAPFLIMVPGLSGSGEGFVSQPFKDFAKREGFVIIAPTFIEDSNNWESRTSYQYPSAWSGQAMNKIINQFAAKENLAPDGVYMLGFSAGAQFVSRYSLLYPNFVTACAVNSAGGIDDPMQYQNTKIYVVIGTNDEDVRKQTAQKFYNSAKQKGIEITYKEYNIGYEYTQEEANDELAFFMKVKNDL